MSYKLKHIDTPLRLLNTINEIDTKAGEGGSGTGSGSSQPTFDYNSQPYKNMTQLLPDTRFRSNQLSLYYDVGITSAPCINDGLPIATGFIGVCDWMQLVYNEFKNGVYKITPIDNVAKTGFKLSCVQEPQKNKIEIGQNENGDPVYSEDNQAWVDLATAEKMELINNGEAISSRETVCNLNLYLLMNAFMGTMVGPTGGPYTFKVKVKQPIGKRIIAFLLLDNIGIHEGRYEPLLAQLPEDERDLAMWDMAVTKVVPVASDSDGYITTETTITTFHPPQIMPIVSGMEMGDSIEIEYMTLAVGNSGAEPVSDEIPPTQEIEDWWLKTRGECTTINVRPPLEEWNMLSRDVKYYFDKTFNNNIGPTVHIDGGFDGTITSMELDPEQAMPKVKIKRVPPIAPMFSGYWALENPSKPLIYAVPQGMEYEPGAPKAVLSGSGVGSGTGYIVSDTAKSPDTQSLPMTGENAYAMLAVDQFTINTIIERDGEGNVTNEYRDLTIMFAEKMYIKPSCNQELFR